jgi:hypothetical protein
MRIKVQARINEDLVGHRENVTRPAQLDENIASVHETRTVGRQDVVRTTNKEWRTGEET